MESHHEDHFTVLNDSVAFGKFKNEIIVPHDNLLLKQNEVFTSCSWSFCTRFKLLLLE